MGTISLMAALGSRDKVQTQHTARTCPSPASHNPSCIGLVNPLLNPTLPLAAPQEPQRCSRKHQAPASLVFAGFPLNSQPCSAHGIQRRDQGGRFHPIHPQNHHARGKENPPLSGVFRSLQTGWMSAETPQIRSRCCIPELIRQQSWPALGRHVISG